MATHPTSSIDYRHYQTQLLARMGLVRWGERRLSYHTHDPQVQSTCTKPDATKPSTPDVTHAHPSSPAYPKESDTPKIGALNDIDAKPSASQSAQPQSQPPTAVTAPNQTDALIKVDSDRFVLLALSYRNFIVLADHAFVSTTSLGIWQSLSTQLTIAGQRDDVALHLANGALSAQMGVSHTLDYPLLTAQNMHKLGGKKPTNNTPTIPKAQMAMTGFLLPLVKLATAYADHTHTRLQVLSLTPLGYGLHLNASVPDVAVPQLNDMITRPQAKRDLWQLLHS